MARSPSRLLSSFALGAVLVLAPPGAAYADDASANTDAAQSQGDAEPASNDAATGTVTHCTANGNPCTSSKECCEGAYCGAFSASSGSDVCGSETPMAIPTSSCSTGRPSGPSGLELVVLVGCVVGVGARRRRRST